MRVVPAFDELEDRHPGLDLGLEATTVQQLAFQRSEEALGHRVVVRVSSRSHRGLHVHLPAPAAKGNRGAEFRDRSDG